jgi:hypothetical protein
MALAFSNEIKALLDGPNFAYLATLIPDASPQSIRVWVGREDGRVLAHRSRIDESNQAASGSWSQWIA